MASGTSMEDSPMEELVDQGLGMEETGLRRSSLRGTSRQDSLLAPDTDFMTDDRSSAASGVDVADRLTYLEQRMQMQEDEIQLLKMALADVLKRLNISEEHQAVNSKKGPAGKARPLSLALPSRPSVNSPVALKKSSTTSTLPSTPTARNYSPLPPSASAKSGVKSPAGSVKEIPCTSKMARHGPRLGPLASSAAPSSKKAESKTKEPAANAGSRRVTHCKVTMQIYLSPLTRRTGSSEAAKSAPTVPNSRPTRTPTPPESKGGPHTSDRNNSETPKKAPPPFTLPLQKSNNEITYSPLDASNYKSPLKSPSQYFQICY
ncbi:echinoderm microtubule-associated protein-like 1 isoform X2 [Esox lucius]|uniref:Echinoderm microtubule-associated protein-like 1 n=1 Tax=Esox lucius TaxID=8010 RepID=A0AAY5K9G6_ESOLU|nr:echinoderm microtubule-associated protein-like 1 isoform X2 [Esox lucius]